MTYIKIQDIDVWFIIKLIHKLSKTKDERFLSQIPFLIGICNFGFKTGYLTINQKTSVSSIHFEYQIFMKIKRKNSKGK